MGIPVWGNGHQPQEYTYIFCDPFPTESWSTYSDTATQSVTKLNNNNAKIDIPINFLLLDFYLTHPHSFCHQHFSISPCSSNSPAQHSRDSWDSKPWLIQASTECTGIAMLGSVVQVLRRRLSQVPLTDSVSKNRRRRRTHEKIMSRKCTRRHRSFLFYFCASFSTGFDPI